MTNARADFELVNKTIGECLRDRVKATPEEIAVEFEGETITWGDLDRLSDWLVLRFKSFGMKKGTKAAIWCGNCLQWVIVYMGLQKIGACAVLVNPGYNEKELLDILEYANVEFLFHGEKFKDTNLSDIIEKMDLVRYPYLKQIVPIELQDAIDFMVDGAYNMTKADYENVLAIGESVKPDDISAMLFTSGTTSTPKGVMLSHYNIVNCAIATAASMKWNETDKMCVMVPMFHCFGMTSSLVASIVSGAELVLMKNTRSTTALEAIEKSKCTILSGVPSMFLAMIANPRFNEFDVSSLKSGIIAGSKIKPEEYKEICKALSLEHLQMSYGQTETSPGITFSGYDQTIDEKADNAGLPIANIEVCIWDKKDKVQHVYTQLNTDVSSTDLSDNNVKAGDWYIEGEIGVRGFLVMQYYHERPLETKAVLEENGWLHTGDLGYLDEKGQLHITGRLKEMIIRGGENISPGEIEEKILMLPGIKEVKVVGVAHSVLQEEVAAAIVLEDNCKVSAEEIKAFLSNNLATYKVPQYYNFVEVLPKTATGKLALGEIKKMMTSYVASSNDNK